MIAIAGGEAHKEGGEGDGEAVVEIGRAFGIDADSPLAVGGLDGQRQGEEFPMARSMRRIRCIGRVTDTGGAQA